MAEPARVLRPFIRIEAPEAAGWWWTVNLVPADRRKTERLSLWPTLDEAREAANGEGERRQLSVLLAVTRGKSNG